MVALALSFFAIATAPTRALAEWENATGSYTYVTSSVSVGSLKVGPLVQEGLTGYGSLIRGGNYTNSTTGSKNSAYNTKPTGNVYVVYMLNRPNNLAKGSKVVATGAIGWLHTNSSTEPTSSSSWQLKQCTVSEVRYFVSDSNNGNQTEVFLDKTGALKLPYSANYLFCVTRLNNFQSVISGAALWYPDADFQFKYELPSDQNEVAAIESQTQTLTDTSGSDSVTNDVASQTNQQIQGLDMFDVTHQISEGIGNAITTQETDTSVTFPGMSLAGFSLPSASIDPLELVPEHKDTIRLMVTFIFCSAFISHIYSLVQAIFGIWEYGAGVEEFGNDAYDKGYKVKSWGANYDIDEDLGF